MPKKRFDPKGRGYDYTGARAAGLRPNSSGNGLAVIRGRDYFLKGSTIGHFPKLEGLRQDLVMK